MQVPQPRHRLTKEHEATGTKFGLGAKITRDLARLRIDRQAIALLHRKQSSCWRVTACDRRHRGPNMSRVGEGGGAMQVRRTVRQLLQDKGYSVWTIHPDASVLEALQLMADKNIGSLVVMDGSAVVGVFTERDYARKVVLLGRASRQLAVREIMTSDLVTVGADASLADCMRLMTDRRVRHLPVMENGAQIGLVSIGDVVKAVMAEQEFLIEQLQGYIQGAI